MNLKDLKELLQILDDKGIAEFELEEEGMKVRVRKTAAPLAPVPVPLVPASAPASVAQVRVEEPPPPTIAAPAESENGLAIVKSPIVGTFYGAPDPDSPSFVNVGDRVKVGQVLCIIEAMKLMNEIEAEVAGEVTRVHHENGQPVQFGEPLFSIRLDH